MRKSYFYYGITIKSTLNQGKVEIKMSQEIERSGWLPSRKREFIEFMLGSGVLVFGDFTTKSGRKTPYFINAGNFKTGAQLARLGQFYAEQIQVEFGGDVTNLFGPAYKGIPIGTAASIALSQRYQREVTVSFDRKEIKDHGEGGWLLGHHYGEEGSNSLDKVVIVEDVTTAGTSVRQSYPRIQACENTDVIGLAVAVDRMEVGPNSEDTGLSALQELSQEFGIKTTSIIQMQDLIGYLQEQVAEGHAEGQRLEQMLEYREKYGAN
jgi:orotate phosphoribosyltransferase